MKKVHRIHMDTPDKRALMALPAATLCATCKVEVPAMDMTGPTIALCGACAKQLFKEFDARLSGVPIGGDFKLLASLASYGPTKTSMVRDAMRRARVSMPERVHQQEPSN